jgi:alpha-maltose-1-phosphate synthase
MIQVEAMGCGIPVISINEMGPKETIVHNKTGFLADVGETVELTEEWVYPDMGFGEQHKKKFEKPKTFAYRASVDQLADYLLRLLTNKELRETMGQEGRKHTLQNFEYHVVAKKMSDIIKNTLSLH